jgi:hypothetical protein
MKRNSYIGEKMSEKRERLMKELGELAYEQGKLEQHFLKAQDALNDVRRKANAKATEIENLDGE